MSNPAAWTFWLKDRQVTGVIIAEHGEEKLVEYAKRIYVVKGKNPTKKHYTQSTIPAFWKKVMNGQLQVEKDLKVLEIPIKEVKAARANRAAVRKEQKEAVSAQAPSKDKAKGTAPAAPPAAKAPAPKKPRARKEKPVETAATPVSSTVAPKQSGKRKSTLPPGPPPDPNSLIWLECPYCKELELVSAFDQEIGKAHIRTCKKCRREFGVRIVPTAFRTEIAAFPGK